MPVTYRIKKNPEGSIKHDLKIILVVFTILLAVLFFGGMIVSFFRGASLQEAVQDVTKKILLNQNIEFNSSNLLEGILYLVIVFIAIGILYYLANLFMTIITKIKLKEIINITRMKRLNNHVIVCGLGRVGRNAIETLKASKVKCIGIDYNDRAIKCLEEMNFLVSDGDCLDENILIKAGIRKAKGLIAALGEDQDNMFLIMTAKHLNPKLRIVSRCNDTRIAQKILFAGANEVVLPEVVGGCELARNVIGKRKSSSPKRKSKH